MAVPVTAVCRVTVTVAPAMLAVPVPGTVPAVPPISVKLLPVGAESGSSASLNCSFSVAPSTHACTTSGAVASPVTLVTCSPANDAAATPAASRSGPLPAAGSR